MIRATFSSIRRGGALLAMALPLVLVSAAADEPPKRRQVAQPNNPPAAPRVNVPNAGQGNRNPFSNPGGGAGGNPAPRRMEAPRSLPNVGNPGNNIPQGQIRSRAQNTPPNGGQPGIQLPRNNQPVLRNNPPGGFNNPNPGGNNPNPGGGNPVLKRRETMKPPVGGNNNPNLGGNNNPGGGNPVLKRRDNPPPNRGGNLPNPGINNPNPGGGNPVLKRRDNNNPPGGLNPNPGNNNPNIGGGNPVLKRRDNTPGGNNTPKPGIGNNPIGGGNPVLKRRDNDNLPGNGPNRNPEINNTLRKFQTDTARRKQNEQNLLRNKDQVDKLLSGNPQLRDRVKTPDGKIDLSKLHLENRTKDRIPSFVNKDGKLPIQLDNDRDLADRFQQRRNPKDLKDLDDRLKHFRDPDVLKRHPELAKVDWKHVSGRFQNRLANDRFDRLTDSRFGKQLNLSQQFNLYRRGDVARQMNLNGALINHGGWRNRYVGPVFAGFTAHSFSNWYCGPGYYPAYCWTPNWSPWVDWCWWNTCPIIYDPRPIYCRPIYYYDPCPVWVVYDYPAWQPLPVVASGTWVDLPEPQLVENVDLQLLAVRFVDGGHPEQQLGTRYRVWVQNHSRDPINTPFNVLLMAGNAPEPAADLPQAGVTVTEMDAGEMKVLDIRLPFDANKMNRQDNHSTPFEFLHVLVDSHQQLNDVNPENNGTVLARADILPVDPAAFAPDVAAAAPGAMVSIAGEGFGPEPGRLILTINGEQTEATIYGWYDLGVQFELPNVDVAEATDVEVLVVRGDGATSNPVTVRVAPENKLEQAALPPAPEP